MEPKKRQQSGMRKRGSGRKGIDRRTEILAAAVESVVADGYARTSVSQVARRAGVPRPLVQYYFPTRELMLRAAIDRILEEWEANYFLSASTEAPGTTDIATGVRNLWLHMHDPSYRAVQELRSAARTDAALATILDELDAADSHRRRAKAVSAFEAFSAADPAAFAAARAFTTIFLEGLLEHRFGSAEETSDAETQLMMLSALLTSFWVDHGIPATGRKECDEPVFDGSFGALKRLVGEMAAQVDILSKRPV